jgi:thiamine-phosphate pyrophosphorylase
MDPSDVQKFRSSLRGYYAIADVVGENADENWLRRKTEELLSGRPCCLQMRGKSLTTATLVRFGRIIRELCAGASVPLCVNDRLDVALAIGADAVHLGQGDLPLVDAIRLRGGSSHPFVGVSTHSLAEALVAEADGADYIGFGPVFATQTKSDAGPPLGLEELRRIICAIRIPVVAIGGITLENIGSVVATGAASASAISFVSGAADPILAARMLGKAFRP